MVLEAILSVLVRSMNWKGAQAPRGAGNGLHLELGAGVKLRTRVVHFGVCTLYLAMD